MTAAAATAVALSSQTGAHADPTPTKDEAKSQLDQLYHEAEVATEKYNAATEKQQTLQKQANDLQNQMARRQAQVSTAQSGLAEIAADQYRNNGMSPTVQLMLSSDPDSFLSKADSAQLVGRTRADALKALRTEQSRLDQQKAEAQQKLTDLDATAKDLKAATEEVRAKLAKAQALLNSLTQQERDQFAQADAKAAADAKTAAHTASPTRASRSDSRTGLDSNTNPKTTKDAGTATGPYAAAAVAAVKAEEGKPYVRGGTGPNSFDCSGLMVWAYAKAGITLPRTSQDQASAGTDIGTDISNARPGDLVIYFNDHSHVGMYVGGGQIIHAPQPGKTVQYLGATVMPIAAIIRI
ncbi:NlpC/P60 family protein [Kitasatospora sp. NPDC057542]|uniref:C40 family peptidase n=1 Tax=Kitasatospora sp. NPDC057542 TaxID=3346162 RepID=UPI0036996A43